MKKKAVIFDMDGVISDTQKYHAQVESQLLRGVGINMAPEEITRQYAGVSDEKMFSEIFSQHNVKNNNIHQLILEKWGLMEKMSAGKLKPIPYAIELINRLKQNRFKLAIASASTKDFIKYVLRALNIKDQFEIIVSAQEVKHGKPAPDIFLLAIRRLSVNVDEVVVIEDGKSGMIGAHKAGIKCIGLVQDIIEDYPADILVTSLGQVSIESIQKL